VSLPQNAHAEDSRFVTFTGQEAEAEYRAWAMANAKEYATVEVLREQTIQVEYRPIQNDQAQR
jgi:hypothetical protein